MAVTEALIHNCSACGTERPFEQPPCVDGHGDDCPEWACVHCGGALLIGLPPIDAWWYDDLPIDDRSFDGAGDADGVDGDGVDGGGTGRRASGSPSQAA
jgi:hypothetical protein